MKLYKTTITRNGTDTFSWQGSQAEAARILDLPLRTLQHRLSAHGIKKGGYEGPSSKG